MLSLVPAITLVGRVLRYISLLPTAFAMAIPPTMSIMDVALIMVQSNFRMLIYHFALQNLQSSYLANGLERLIASDFSAQNPFRTEDFCIIIIEAQILETQKPQKAHRSPIEVLSWSPILFYACADSSKWGLFGRCTRSAFRRTPSGRLTRK